MHSVVLDRFGGPEVLEVRPVEPPTVPPDQVRVRVSFATVNPTDVLLRSGAQAASLESRTGPWTPGMELSGTVDAVGKDVTIGLRPGEGVIGLVNPRRCEGGAQSGWICVPATWLAPQLANIGEPEAATLAMNGVTALMVLEALQAASARTVLVTGAAGALGGYVVQLARSAGLTVVGHGRPGDEALIESLGAAHVVSGSDDLAATTHRLGPGGVDALVDSASLGAGVRTAVRPGGLVVDVRPIEVPDDGRRSHTVSVMKRLGDVATLRRVAKWAEEGILTPRVNTVLPVADVQQAYHLVEEGGLRGRVVLDLREDPQ